MLERVHNFIVSLTILLFSSPSINLMTRQLMASTAQSPKVQPLERDMNDGGYAHSGEVVSHTDFNLPRRTLTVSLVGG